MQRNPIYVFLATVVLFGVLSSAILAVAAQTTVVKLSEVPPGAQRTIHTQLGAARLGEIAKSIERGEVSYDVEMTAQRKTRSFTVSEEGELLAVEVFLGELPRPVQRAIREQVGKGKLGEISKTTEDGEITYDVEMTKDGKTRSFTLAADGKLVELQVFLDETPAAVRQAIQREAKNGTCGEILKTIED